MFLRLNYSYIISNYFRLSIKGTDNPFHVSYLVDSMAIDVGEGIKEDQMANGLRIVPSLGTVQLYSRCI